MASIGIGLSLSLKSVKAAPVVPPTGLWLLVTGLWENAGLWDDTATWNDGA